MANETNAYTVVHEETLPEFILSVNEHISDNWQPIGGAFHVHKGQESHYCQAMISKPETVSQILAKKQRL